MEEGKEEKLLWCGAEMTYHNAFFFTALDLKQLAFNFISHHMYWGVQ